MPRSMRRESGRRKAEQTVKRKLKIKSRIEEEQKMKKNFKLENLDCANCAAKMEAAINKLDGVTAVISFMTSSLTLEAEDSVFETAVENAQKAISKVEPDCVIVR